MCEFPECSVLQDPQLQRMRRLIGWLEDWAKWQQGYDIRTGYPPKSCGLSCGFVSKSFDDMADDNEQEICAIIDVVIDDMGRHHPAQKAAIMRRYLAVSFRFPRNNYEKLLEDAHLELLATLPGRGVVV